MCAARFGRIDSGFARPSFQRSAEQLVHGFNQDNVQFLFHLDGHIGQIFFIEFGDDNGLQTGALGGERFFLEGSEGGRGKEALVLVADNADDAVG